MSGSAMLRKSALGLVVIGLLLAATGTALGETRTASWDPVTTYTDNTPIEAGKTVTYTVYWTTDAGLALASLRTIASSVTQTSATFDPDVQGMPRGQTVYFTIKTVLSTGEESALAPAYAWVVPLSGGPPTLSSLSISGPSSVNEGSTGTYAATATWSDNTTTTVAPTWSVSPAYATIDASGVLTAGTVSATQTVTVTASYTSGGVTKTATKSVSIVDIPSRLPAPPGNIDITGPVQSAPTATWRLSWDPVVTYADGSLLDAGASVRYTAYWTVDSSLSPASLQPLVSLTPGTSIEFDPAAQGMVSHQRVYLTTRATLDTGAQSGLSSALSWRVSNPGPASPLGGRILKKAK
ncbi:MAG: hypothetical protein M1550_05815 [Deltaproteobacteria bacterium]|nr:hypothetical protein [Deltaproteobacteria bacterium]